MYPTKKTFSNIKNICYTNWLNFCSCITKTWNRQVGYLIHRPRPWLRLHDKRSHNNQGYNFFFQSTHVASTYQIVSPKIKWKHITYISLFPFEEKFFNHKMSSNINCSDNNNLALCVSMLREIDVQITNNLHLLIDYFFIVPNFPLYIPIW